MTWSSVGCAALTGLVLTACGSGTSVIAGEDYERLNAPLPIDRISLRLDLEITRDTLRRVESDNEQGSGSHAASCERLFDVVRALDDGFSRYSITSETARLVSLAYANCDSTPGRAAENLSQAILLVSNPD